MTYNNPVDSFDLRCESGIFQFIQTTFVLLMSKLSWWFYLSSHYNIIIMISFFIMLYYILGIIEVWGLFPKNPIYKPA